MRPWTGQCGGEGTRARPCFNGATALRPWTAAYLYAGRRAATQQLQWGHGLAAVDGRGGRQARLGRRASMGPRPCGRGRFSGFSAQPPDCPASMGPRPCGRGRHEGDRRQGSRDRASMGPRPCGRGRAASGSARRSRWCSFNGATALRPWTGPNPKGHSPRPRASMGPRPCGRGRLAEGDQDGPIVVLQWGHGLAAVDGRNSPRTSVPRRRFNGATALRPWTERGVPLLEARRCASMGPRPCGRGRVAP